MGYRLSIENESKTIEFYGTKHYGYSFVFKSDGMKYPSYRYLIKLKKITGGECWDYGCSPEIILTAEQFEHFIKLYSKELEEIDGYLLISEKEIAELLKSNERKIISWG